ncbi:MAG: hypothetical protein B6D64_10515 [Bacteroidetes bacterium 4484_276]|nr:MAG: hypothetical protein B6D64_10515 [Bacteroidetes bacterium 4484_276]
MGWRSSAEGGEQSAESRGLRAEGEGWRAVAFIFPVFINSDRFCELCQVLAVTCPYGQCQREKSANIESEKIVIAANSVN